MAQEITQVSEDKPDHHFRTEIPNIMFDIGYSIGALALYGYYKRVSGDSSACWRSNSKIGKDLGISSNTIIKYQNELASSHPLLGSKSPIKVTHRKTEVGDPDTTLVQIVNIWGENGSFYRDKEKNKGISKFEGGVSQSLREGTSKFEHKEELLKKNTDSMSVLPSPVGYEAIEMMEELRKAQDADQSVEASTSSVEASTSSLPASLSTAPAMKSILIRDTNGNSTMISESDLFLRSSQKRFKCTSDELKEAWVALQSKRGPVSDWWAFIEAVVKNKRNERKGAAYGAKQAMGAKGGKKKSEYTATPDRILTDEEQKEQKRKCKENQEHAKNIFG